VPHKGIDHVWQEGEGVGRKDGKNMPQGQMKNFWHSRGPFKKSKREWFQDDLYTL